jgi:iron complex outermembrane receptor protein
MHRETIKLVEVYVQLLDQINKKYSTCHKSIVGIVEMKKTNPPVSENGYSRLKLLTASIFASLYPVTPALAQDADNEEFMLEEVLVTATKREVNMQTVPQSIQTFTGDDVIRANFTSLTDLANATPSLTVVSDQPGRSSVKFRGISTGTQEFYTPSMVAVYMDETPMTFNSQQLWPAMVDIHHIESLPGPQGTLYGSASQSGTVRIVTNKPNHDGYAGEVFGQYYATKGGSGSYDLNGWVNIPLIKDTLSIRLVAYQRDEGGWIDNVYGETWVQPDDRFQAKGNNADVVEKDQNNYKLTGARASILWDITENWQTSLSYVTEKGELDGAWGVDTYLGDGQITRFFDEYRDDDWYNASLIIEGDLGFATLTSSTSYLERDINYEWDRMNYSQWKDSYWGQYYPLYNNEYTYGTISNEQHQDRFAQEIRLTSNTDSRFQWMIGGYYEDTNDDWFYGALNPDLMDTIGWEAANYYAYWANYYGYDVQYPLADTNFNYTDELDRSVKQKAAFGEISYEFTDKWSATVGARWFEYERNEVNTFNFPFGLPPESGYAPDGGTLTTVTKDNDTLYKFSTQYQFTDDNMVYFLFSQGFRLGGRNDNKSVNTGLVPQFFNPDYLDNYEVGMKTRWLDGRMQLNVTAFLMKWKDYQLSEGGIDGIWWLNGTVNGGSVEQRGLEADLSLQATANLRFDVRAYFGDPQATSRYEFLNGDVMEIGDPLPNSPKRRYNFSVDYTFEKPVFSGSLWTRFDYSYGSETFNSIGAATNPHEGGIIPAWHVSNWQLGLSLPSNWTVTMFVNNLFNNTIVNGRSDGSGDAEYWNDPRWANVEYRARPRSVGLSFRKGWY